MTLLEIILIGLGLSMDAAAVSIANGLTYRNLTGLQKLSMPLAFGLFQALMPVLGYWAGSLFADIISRYAGITAFVILGIIGGKMIKDAFEPENDTCQVTGYTLGMLLAQAVATSIDAFAVGVSLCASGCNILAAAPIIGVTTFICSLAALGLGKLFGARLGVKAQLLGGIILVLIGIKNLLG